MTKPKTEANSNPADTSSPSGSSYHSAQNSILEAKPSTGSPASTTTIEESGLNSLEESYEMIRNFDYANAPLKKSEIEELEDFLEALAIEQEQEREFPVAIGAKARVRRKRRELIELKMPFAEVVESSGAAGESMYQSELAKSSLSYSQGSAIFGSNYNAEDDKPSARRPSSAYDRRDQRRASRLENLATLEKVRQRSESTSPETDPDFDSDASQQGSTSDPELAFDSSLEGEVAYESADELWHELELDVDEHRLEWMKELELKRTIEAVVERMVWNANQGAHIEDVKAREGEGSEDEAEGGSDEERTEWREILLAASANVACLAALWALSSVPLGGEIR